MNTVHTVLEKKGREVWSVRRADSVFDALQLMADKKIGAVVVVEDDAPVGIFSERDYARSIVLRGRVSRETPVEDVMSRDVSFVRPDQTVEECMALMTDRHLRHLPVMHDDRLVGLVSIGDVVKAVIERKDVKLRALHNEITGYDQFHRF